MFSQLLPIGTRVRHVYTDGHGTSTIVEYNGVQPNNYLKERMLEAVDIAVSTGFGQALVSLAYDGARYPYVVEFDSGYRDVYSPHDVVAL